MLTCSCSVARLRYWLGPGSSLCLSAPVYEICFVIPHFQFCIWIRLAEGESTEYPDSDHAGSCQFTITLDGWRVQNTEYWDSDKRATDNKSKEYMRQHKIQFTWTFYKTVKVFLQKLWLVLKLFVLKHLFKVEQDTQSSRDQALFSKNTWKSKFYCNRAR